jgi:hypothetical protein
MYLIIDQCVSILQQRVIFLLPKIRPLASKGIISKIRLVAKNHLSYLSLKGRLKHESLSRCSLLVVPTVNTSHVSKACKLTGPVI